MLPLQRILSKRRDQINFIFHKFSINIIAYELLALIIQFQTSKIQALFVLFSKIIKNSTFILIYFNSWASKREESHNSSFNRIHQTSNKQCQIISKLRIQTISDINPLRILYFQQLYPSKVSPKNKNWHLRFIISMIQSISIVIAAFLLLTPLASTACLNTNQLDGLCSACTYPQILIAGFCLTPIPGCLNQLSPNVCGSCLSGWVLVNNLCLNSSGISTQQAVLLNELETYTEQAPDIKYQLCDFYFKNKYVAQLYDKISNVSMEYHLKTTYGDVYALTYTNPYSNGVPLYRGQALVNYFNNISQFRFVQIDPSAINNYSALLWFIDRKVIVNNLTTLQDVTLNQVQQISSNDFRFFYINYQGAIFVKDVQRQLNTSTPQTFPSLSQLYYQINQNTVINYAFSLFPRLQLHNSYIINYYTIYDIYGTPIDYYKFIFDSQIIVIIQVNGLALSLYSYEEPDNVVNLPTAPTTGGYLTFVNLQDPAYLEVKQAILSRYSFLGDKTLHSVRYQVVAGTNFMLEFTNQPFSNDKYLAMAFKPLTGASSVKRLLKNGYDISNTIVSTGVPGAFNYGADPTFKSVYTQFGSAVKSTIKNVLPISSVQYVVNPNQTIDYMVIYTSVQYTYLRTNLYYNNNYQILSYTAFGLQIPITPTQLPSSNRSAIISFLQTSKSSLFGTIILLKMASQLQSNNNIYEVDILTSFGTYYTRVHEKNLLYLSKITQTSLSTCHDLDPSEYSSNSIVSSLNTFILQNYWQVSGYTLSLVQGYISSSGSISYRMLYANQNQRYQVQIIQSYGNYLINRLTSYSGTGCSPMSVLVGGICTKSCSSFTF